MGNPHIQTTWITWISDMDDFERSLEKALKSPEFEYLWKRTQEEEMRGNVIEYVDVLRFSKEYEVVTAANAKLVTPIGRLELDG